MEKIVTKHSLETTVEKIKKYIDSKSGGVATQEWTSESNANDYTTSGIYQFAGWRKSQSDNLPITNYDEDDIDRNNIAFTLVVNTKDGYLLRNNEGNVTRNIPTMIAQTLMLGNRRGSDTKLYTRHGQVDLSTNTTTWGEWKEVMTSTYLGVVDSYNGDVLNGATEIGLYTGAMVDLASNVADVFKLEVINNYAVTTQVSATTGTSVPNSVLQTITILNLDGSNFTKKRIGTYNGSGYTWGDWAGNSVSTPDWNQSDETAPDFIKNRTHYEYIGKYVGLNDNEYEAKLKEGKHFSPVKMHSITIENNECTILNNSVQVGNIEEFNSLMDGIYWGLNNASVINETNSTLISPMIKINGKEVLLNWDIRYGQYNYSEVTSFDGLDVVLYGLGKVPGPSGIYIYAKGFVFKNYSYTTKVNGETMPSVNYGTSSYKTFLIDKTVYGEAPYTIDFYFECEQIIKKIDEKFLPDSVFAKKPKFKTGDVVYRTSSPTLHFGVISWEDYVKNPTNDMSTKVPIGLVVDPIKRTFLFCELFNKYFCNSENIETYFGGYTSFEDGSETFERILRLRGTSKAADIPAFYGLRNQGNMEGTIFYEKNDVSYIPSIKEWKIAKEKLCTAFYTNENDVSSPYAGFMDRLIALKTGVTPSNTLFIGRHPSGLNKLFYSQLSTVGKTFFNNGTLGNSVFNMNGDVTVWENGQNDYACCPVFGIYTEEEENA